MNNKRSKVVSYLYPHFIDEMTYGTTKLDNSMNFDILLKPFHWIIWLCIFGSMIIILTFNRLQNILIKYDCNNKDYDDDNDNNNDDDMMTNVNNTNRYKLSNGKLFWILLSILFHQPSGDLRIFNIYIKTCLIVWILSSIILAIVYNSFIYSLLARQMEYQIDTIEKLVRLIELENLRFIVQRNTTAIEIFHDSSQQQNSFRLIYNSLLQVNTNREGIEKILSFSSAAIDCNCQMKYAMIITRFCLEYYQKLYGMNSFYLPPSNGQAVFYNVFISIPTRKQFPFRKEFSTLSVNKINLILINLKILNYF